MKTKVSIALLIILLLAACKNNQQQQVALHTKQPADINNICNIFNQYPEWYADSKRVADKWGVPIHVQMATIYQESKFQADAKPPYKELLQKAIPEQRQSSAVGFAQALNPSWHEFQEKTGNNGSRTSFAAAAEFIGWYGNLLHRYFGIPLHNAYLFYLAYHEGPSGYLHHSYLHKIWLIHVAYHVQQRAQIYQSQLLSCRDQLEHIIQAHSSIAANSLSKSSDLALLTNFISQPNKDFSFNSSAMLRYQSD